MLGFVGSGTSEPFEVYVSTARDWAPRKLTGFNDALRDRPLGKTEVVRWMSADGMEIEGLLTYPVSYEPGKRYPLLTALHGGPVGALRQYYIAADMAYPMAALSADGYAVFRPNIRGSDGRGGDSARPTYHWGRHGLSANMMTGIRPHHRLGGWRTRSGWASWMELRADT